MWDSRTKKQKRLNKEEVANEKKENYFSFFLNYKNLYIVKMQNAIGDIL